VVNPALQVSTVKDLVAYLKSNPGKVNFGTPAPSSANALEIKMFLHSSGTRAMQIPYKGGAGPATIGLLGSAAPSGVRGSSVQSGHYVDATVDVHRLAR
jgi:tripartite-type tricarboxylate transporter receptor subunit TctC